MRKVIVLNKRDLTSSKQKLLNAFVSEYLRVTDKHLAFVPVANTQTDLHHLTYSRIRKTSFLPSDIIQEARKDTWKCRKHLERKGFNGEFTIKNCAIRLNKRWFKYVETERRNPCFKITYSPRKQFAIPIETDRQFQRFQSFLEDDWSFNNLSVLKDGRIAVVLEKEFEKPASNQSFVVGVDVGSATLAAVTVFDIEKSKVIKQLYFGRDVAFKQRKFERKRARLRALTDKGSSHAKKSLKKLKHKQNDFVKTRSGQIAKEIVNLAKHYNAYIAIERLKNLRAVKGKIRKAGRKKINRIPYAKFKEFLQSNCEIFQVPLHEVDPYHTSKWCVRCGAVNKGHHSKNYALYGCKCGLTVNSDRKASFAVAVKSLLERVPTYHFTNLTQFSKRRVPVNGLLRPNEAGSSSAVHDINQPMESHPTR